jgi:ribonuclease Z
MTIRFDLLGGPGEDNALFVRITTGQSIHRLLFDCGEDCLSQVPLTEIQHIDLLLFSHLHMDHIAGFDAFFRANFNRLTKMNRIYGPPHTARIIQHRFQGFQWNLAEQLEANWEVYDIHPEHLAGWRYQANQAFAHGMPLSHQAYQHVAIQHNDYTISVLQLDHGTPSLGYIVRERPRLNVDNQRLAERGLRPGAWLGDLKYSPHAELPTIDIDGTLHDRAELRADLLHSTPGAALAYLTDFWLTDEQIARVADLIRGVDVLICESQYRHADEELARRNYHMTSVRTAQLAQAGHVGQLVLFHVSERYEAEDLQAMLHDAQVIFPQTAFPSNWIMVS